MAVCVSECVGFNVPPDTDHFGDGLSRQNAHTLNIRTVSLTFIENSYYETQNTETTLT